MYLLIWVKLSNSETIQADRSPIDSIICLLVNFKPQTLTGISFFQNFIQGLSILSRGTLEEKLLWTFSLYDINGDGRITREEMTDIVTAIFELMGKTPAEMPPKRGEAPEKTEATLAAEEKIKEKVEVIFQVKEQIILLFFQFCKFTIF